MAASQTQLLIRRKYSSVDLQQVAVQVDVYNRPLTSSRGSSGLEELFSHEAAVVTTENGGLYLFDKGTDLNADMNYSGCRYREGALLIVRVTRGDVRDWQKMKSLAQVDSGVTLEDLFDACGTEYNVLTDNCWNGVQRILARANSKEDDLSWQAKTAVGVGIVAAIGLGVLALAGKSGEKKKNNKY